MAAAIAALLPAHAQTAPAISGPTTDETPAPDSPARERITVTATRTEEAIDTVPATVTVITAEDIENELATDIKDLVRFEPGVSVRSSPARFGAALGSTGRDGNAGFNVRGLEGNRVLIQVDGVRVADGFGFGPQAVGRGDYVDLDLLKSVELLRGPASALYGSDGVAGAVSFITRDPDDLVADGNLLGVRARSAYASADDSWANSLIGATQTGDWGAMLSYTRRDSHEQGAQGENDEPNSRRTTPNPTDDTSDSYLAKLVFSPGGTHRFRLTYDRMDAETAVEVLSGRTPAPTPPAVLAGSAVIDLDATDTTTRERVAFDHSFKLGQGFVRGGQWSAYTQDSTTRQYTFEDRNSAADRIRDNTFDNSVWGLSGQLDAALSTGPARHRILFGADHSQTEQSGLRGGTVPPAGETFPIRAFPNTTYRLSGVFLQDEISLLDGQLRIYPALRYDAYELEPERDAFYPAGFPATPSEGDHVSPKLGIVADPVDWFGAFLTYSTGYKAPSPGQVNAGFSNLAFGYTSIASPDLKPETSESLEIGARLRSVSWLGADWSAQASAFVADYKDFISQEVVGGSFTPTDPAIYQYINLTQVSINGVEATLNARWDNGLGLRVAASQAAGEVQGAASSPLESIDPAKLVTGLLYDAPGGRFGGQLIATFADGKDIGDVASPALFRPDGFSLLDLTAYWNITDRAALRVGAFNLTDEKYWWWGDVRGQSATSTILDAFTQPGRNYSASVTLKY